MARRLRNALANHKVWILLFLLLKSGSAAETTKKEEKKDAKKYDENYLYLENADPVVEFVRDESEPNPKEPAFIYGSNTGPRLIEFYAPWCPHVRC